MDLSSYSERICWGLVFRGAEALDSGLFAVVGEGGPSPHPGGLWSTEWTQNFLSVWGIVWGLFPSDLESITLIQLFVYCLFVGSVFRFCFLCFVVLWVLFVSVYHSKMKCCLVFVLAFKRQ